jgi:hypothetical protein
MGGQGFWRTSAKEWITIGSDFCDQILSIVSQQVSDATGCRPVHGIDKHVEAHSPQANG